jgi:hypothetical protein
MTSSSTSNRGGRLRALKQDLKRAARLDWTTWGDLTRAVVELAIARLRLGTAETRELLSRMRHDPPPVSTSDQKFDSIVDRVSFAIPRVGARVPWRADCLVQALAAQHWLRRRRVLTTLFIGVRKSTTADLEAHAWLMAGDRIITGGQAGPYHPIFEQQ